MDVQGPVRPDAAESVKGSAVVVILDSKEISWSSGEQGQLLAFCDSSYNYLAVLFPPMPYAQIPKPEYTEKGAHKY